MRERMYCSNELSKKLGLKHGYVANIIKNLQSACDSILLDDTNALQFLGNDFVCEAEDAEYRGNKFVKYKMNKAFLLLVLGRMKNKAAIELKIILIGGLLAVEKKASESLLSEAEKIWLIGSSLDAPIRSPEKEYSKRIISNWDNIFPMYQLIDTEVETPDHERIDILARTDDNRDVIIEVKPNAKSAHKQLRSYAVHYDNPILVNITPKIPKNKAIGISYVTF